MDLNHFLTPPADSARRKGPYDRIVMSSRVRLARNLKDVPFPGVGQEAGPHPGAGGDPAGDSQRCRK